ncbi:hypothetical protein Tco_1478434 [Tanacetum coccineum]
MPPKRMSTSETPAINLAAIQQLINDGISLSLKVQAASMTSNSNPNRNTRPTGTPAPLQPPPPPPAPARTMPQRMARLKEDMHEIREALTEQRETHVPYQRRVRRRTDEAGTSAAQQDQQQPDP